MMSRGQMASAKKIGKNGTYNIYYFNVIAFINILVCVFFLKRSPLTITHWIIFVGIQLIILGVLL